jgi:hypothetical protein
MVKSIFLRPWDMLCVIWFLVHIPITVMLDSHSSKSWSLWPSAAQALVLATRLAPFFSPTMLYSNCTNLL